MRAKDILRSVAGATLVAAVAFALTPTSVSAQPTTASTQTARFSTTATPINDILANPAAKAVLDARLPEVSHSEHLAMIGTMTLKDLQGLSPPGRITDETLAAIDADFARLPH